MADPDFFRQMATAEASGEDGSIEVVMARVIAGSGVVFRYVDPTNFWTITASPSDGTWRVERVVDGLASEMAVFPGPALDGTVVRVFFEEDKLKFTIDNFLKDEIMSPVHAAAGGFGFVAAGPDAQAAAWDSIIVRALR
jgi:hypothetical protein